MTLRHDAFGRQHRRMARWRGRLYRRLLPDVFGPDMRVGPGLVLDSPEGIHFGHGVILAAGCMFACQRVRPEAAPSVTVGPKTFFNQGAVVSSTGDGIRIGTDVLFGPNVCVVDDDHRFDQPGVPVARQGMTPRGPVEIGDGAWLAAGAVVLGGTSIAAGSVVGANSVVRGVFPERCVLAGAPAKVVRLLDREEV